MLFEDQYLRQLIAARPSSFRATCIALCSSFDSPELSRAKIPTAEDWTGRILNSSVEKEEAKIKEILKKNRAGTMVVKGWKKVKHCDLLVFSFASHGQVSDQAVLL